ncbi:MAG: hypothetical protein IPK66_14575 [Rhodospirillales bacterium]|nr:hypothetical protein [Rhodospirillales bacterium]
MSDFHQSLFGLAGDDVIAGDIFILGRNAEVDILVGHGEDASYYYYDAQGFRGGDDTVVGDFLAGPENAWCRIVAAAGASSIGRLNSVSVANDVAFGEGGGDVLVGDVDRREQAAELFLTAYAGKGWDESTLAGGDENEVRAFSDVLSGGGGGTTYLSAISPRFDRRQTTVAVPRSERLPGLEAALPLGITATAKTAAKAITFRPSATRWPAGTAPTPSSIRPGTHSTSGRGPSM